MIHGSPANGCRAKSSKREAHFAACRLSIVEVYCR
jgi:hypothetical protein